MKLFLISLIFIFSFCKKIFPDDELSISRRDYNGEALKFNGYYYKLSDNNKLFSVMFFYKNGVIIDTQGGFESFESAETYVQNIYIQKSNYKASKLGWGVYVIESNCIKFEEWHSSSGGGLPAYVWQGEILNDTTFHITQSYRMKNGKKKEIRGENEIYHFKAFSPKPDSTNKFIN